MPSISVPLAFLAGLLSFASPCVVPLVPAYLGYLSGSDLYSQEAPLRRQPVLTHALCFVGGFTLVFVILFGLPTTLLGSALLQYSAWVSRVGGAILVLFGLHTIGLLSIPFLYATRRLSLAGGTEPGYLRSLGVGATFGFGWTPCIGPLLGTVMTLALTEPSRAVGLLSVYALGLAVPFLATAALLSQALGWLKRLNRHMRAIKAVSGLLMIVVGVLLVTGTFTALHGLFARITPAWLIPYL